MNYKDESSDNSISDNDDLGLLRKALHVDLPENFDPNKVPENGEEYLQHVMYEAKMCPNFMVAPAPVKIPRNASINENEIQAVQECLKAPSSLLPTRKWQDETVEDFTKFRKFVFKKLETQAKTTIPNIKKLIASDLPRFTIIAGLSQENKVKALETILEHMGHIKPGKSLTRQKSIWIYSLLATLDIPLCPDTCYFLRELARKCAEIRSHLDDNAPEEDYQPLNVYICLIARFYRQLDLADE